MMRTKRVFGAIKAVHGPRVSRSGRRLWPESGDEYSRFKKSEDEAVNQDPEKLQEDGASCTDRRYGLVYTRKRNKIGTGVADFLDKKYGLQKKRSSLRRMKARNPSLGGVHKAGGPSFGRYLPAPIVKVIPVPGVRQVQAFQDVDGLPFQRPYSYICIKADQVSRAMAKRMANYDMDSEDEEWLKKFNNGFLAGSDLLEQLPEDSFELMIDAFEKAYYCSRVDYSNEEAAANLCLDMGRREVVEAVYGYWLKKRKQRRSALLRVFQKKISPFVPKRKRRSFRCHGRGRQPSVLQAVAVEEDAVEEQNALQQVEQARVSANRSMESAVEKRQRVQLLMENANMATYKAMVALRIAEAARVVVFSDAANAIPFYL
ncbi:hypothetical protein SLE2022_067820 [Rubroshorea leprosula]